MSKIIPKIVTIIYVQLIWCFTDIENIVPSNYFELVSIYKHAYIF